MGSLNGCRASYEVPICPELCKPFTWKCEYELTAFTLPISRQRLTGIVVSKRQQAKSNTVAYN